MVSQGTMTDQLGDDDDDDDEIEWMEAEVTAPWMPTRDIGTDPPEPEHAEIAVQVDERDEHEDMDTESYELLVGEFEEWIYAKTQLMPRDQAFNKMLPGLMLRWLKEKKIEVWPKDFTDGLMKAALERVKPSKVEESLADIITKPETRCSVERLNDAIKGEVSVVDEAKQEQWVDRHANKVHLYWFTFWFGWNPAFSFNVDWIRPGHTTGLYTLWFLFLYLMQWWFGEPVEPDFQEIWLPWYDEANGFYLWQSWFSAYWTMEWLLLGCVYVSYFGWLRRRWFRLQYQQGEYVSEGYFKRGETIKLFNAGNVKSR